MKNRETKERFTPPEFHNRYASVILGRDAWGPTLRVSVKKPGRYEISVTSEGYSTPVLREEMEFKGLDREQVIRLPSRMSGECIERSYLTLRPK